MNLLIPEKKLSDKFKLEDFQRDFNVIDQAVGKLQEGLETVNTSLDNIIKSTSSKSTEELQEFLDNIPNDCNVKMPLGYYEIDNVLILSHKRNVCVDFTGCHIKINKHGYGVLEINNCNGIEIIGGKFEGYGLFPSNIWDNETQTLTNEKLKTEHRSNWGFYRNGSNQSFGTYGNGYLNNCGFGILIRGASENIKVNGCESFGFNYVGIGVGFLGDGNSSTNLQEYNKNIEIMNCYSHNNFCAGIHTMAVDGCYVHNNKCENNGHYDAKLTDGYVDPGYGITCRSANSYSKNVEIKNNICIGNKRKGIDTHGSENLIIDGNYIKDTTLIGIALAYTGYPIVNTIIRNNYLENCGISSGLIGSILGNPQGGIIFTNNITGNNVIENNTIVNCGKLVTDNCSCVGLEVKGIEGSVIVKGNNLIESGSKNNVVLKAPYLIFSDNNIKFDNSKCVSSILLLGETTHNHIIKNNNIKGQYQRVLQVDTIQDVVFRDNIVSQTMNVARPIEYINGGSCVTKDNKGIVKGGVLGVNDTGKAQLSHTSIRYQCYNTGSFGVVGGNKSIVTNIKKNENNIEITFADDITVELVSPIIANNNLYNKCNQIYTSSLSNNVATIVLRKDNTTLNPITELISNEQFLINVSYYE